MYLRAFDISDGCRYCALLKRVNRVKGFRVRRQSFENAPVLLSLYCSRLEAFYKDININLNPIAQNSFVSYYYFACNFVQIICTIPLTTFPELIFLSKIVCNSQEVSILSQKPH